MEFARLLGLAGGCAQWHCPDGRPSAQVVGGEVERCAVEPSLGIPDGHRLATRLRRSDGSEALRSVIPDECFLHHVLRGTFVAQSEEGQRVEAVLPLVDDAFQLSDVGAFVHFSFAFYS